MKNTLRIEKFLKQVLWHWKWRPEEDLASSREAQSDIFHILMGWR